MYSGQAAIDYLAAEINKNDSGASSHWQKYHSALRFLGNRFEGLQGFGGSEEPHRGLRRGLNHLLQHRFRQMGAVFPEFKALDSRASEITVQQGRAYDLDVLRQVLTLAFLNTQIPNKLTLKATCCVIGDGFASMTALSLASGTIGRVVLINLTKTLLVDLWYLKLWMGAQIFESSVDLVTDESDLTRALAKPAANEAGGGGGAKSDCDSSIEPRIAAVLSGGYRFEYRIDAGDGSSGHCGLLR